MSLVRFAAGRGRPCRRTGLAAGQIGYVKMRVFGDKANDELEEAFRAFDNAHVKGYVLDLRNNGGGYSRRASTC